MEIGGWTTLRQVERYAHVNNAELQRAVRITHEHTEAAKKGATPGTTPAGSAGEKSERTAVAKLSILKFGVPNFSELEPAERVAEAG